MDNVDSASLLWCICEGGLNVLEENPEGTKGRTEELTEEQQKQLNALLNQFSVIFANL